MDFQETRFVLTCTVECLGMAREVWGLPVRQAGTPRYRVAERNQGLDITYLVLNHTFIVP